MPKVPTLRGKVVATLFFEESTRTRLSFETAAKRLSADVLSLAVATSSVKKGESLRDTVETVEAMGIDAVIIRHASAGAPHQVARWVERAHVVNAGDGWHEHPTQALLDCFTVRQVLAERKGVAPDELGVGCFEGLRVLIVGDVRHSRVARSEVLAYTALGAHVTLVAPGSLLPPSLDGWPVEVAADLDDALGRRRRGLAPAPAVRARQRVLRAQPARVHGRLGPDGAPGRAPGRARHRHAPRADGARGRDRLRRRRPAAHRGHPAGGQRRRGAHGHPLPAARAASCRARRRCRPLPELTLVIRGGTVVGPDGLAPSRRRRRAVGPSSAWPSRIDAPRGATVLDAGGCLVGPGLVDLHTHLRQPGREEAETIEIGRPGRRPRRLHGHRGHAQHGAGRSTRPAWPARCWRSARGCLAEVAVAGAITVGRAGAALAPLGRAGRARGHALHRRRRRCAGRGAHAPRPRLRQGARRHAGPALRGQLPGRRRGHARGRLVEPARASRACPRPPRRPWSPATSRWSA